MKKIKEKSFFFLSKRALSPDSQKDPTLGTNVYAKSRKGKVRKKIEVPFFISGKGKRKRYTWKSYNQEREKKIFCKIFYFVYLEF